MLDIKKYLPVRIHHINYSYGWWFGDRFYFWCGGPVIVPMYNELHRAVYAYSGNSIEHGKVNSWDDERSFEKKLNKIRKKYRIIDFEFAHISDFKYVIERRRWFGGETVAMTKTYEDAKERLNKIINECLSH